MHRVGVHHPGHDLRRRVDVGGRDVSLGADEDADLGRVAPGERLELLERELLGVDDDAALAAAVRDPDDRALPGHPHGEGLDLVDADVLVIADAALGRATTEVVLDAVAGEDADRPVVHLDREGHGECPARLAQDLADARVQLQMFGREVELLLGNRPRVDRRGDLFGGHGAEILLLGRPGRGTAVAIAARSGTATLPPPGRLPVGTSRPAPRDRLRLDGVLQLGRSSGPVVSRCECRTGTQAPGGMARSPTAMVPNPARIRLATFGPFPDAPSGGPGPAAPTRRAWRARRASALQMPRSRRQRRSSIAAPTTPGPRCGPTDGPTVRMLTCAGSTPPGTRRMTVSRNASMSSVTV